MTPENRARQMATQIMLVVGESALLEKWLIDLITVNLREVISDESYCLRCEAQAEQMGMLEEERDELLERVAKLEEGLKLYSFFHSVAKDMDTK